MSKVERMSPSPSCCMEACIMPAAPPDAVEAAEVKPEPSARLVKMLLTNSEPEMFSTKSIEMSDTAANIAVANMVEMP